MVAAEMMEEMAMVAAEMMEEMAMVAAEMMEENKIIRLMTSSYVRAHPYSDNASYGPTL
jgi:hypothetical protein